MVGRYATALVVAATMLAIAAAGTVAQAEDKGQHKDTRGSMGHHMGSKGGGMKGPEHMAAMQAARIAYLKTALGITEAQMPVWNAYVEALKANQPKKMGKKDKKGKKDATAIQKMDARIARSKAKLARLEAMKPTTEALYNALDAKQKETADSILMRRRVKM
jgi:hypothetical protein